VKATVMVPTSCACEKPDMPGRHAAIGCVWSEAEGRYCFHCFIVGEGWGPYLYKTLKDAARALALPPDYIVEPSIRKYKGHNLWVGTFGRNSQIWVKGHLAADPCPEGWL
jgi:hypothetical protein